jgi:hypothetical protein
MGNLWCLQADRQQFGHQDVDVGEVWRLLKKLSICDRIFKDIYCYNNSLLFANQILSEWLTNKKLNNWMHGTDLAGNGNRSSAGLQISHILWNTMVNNTVCIIRLPVIIYRQINQVHVRHPTSCIAILLLFSHLRLGLSSGLFLTGLHTKTL